MEAARNSGREMPPKKGFGLFQSQGESVFSKKSQQNISEDTHKLSDDIDTISRRVKLVEDRVDALRKHFDILDDSLVSKHKATIKELRRMEDDMRELRNIAQENKSMVDRIVKRLEAFATSDKVAVLEKYISVWQPLKYTTTQEVERIVDEKLAALKESEEV